MYSYLEVSISTREMRRSGGRGAVWFDSLDKARSAAHWAARFTLAHRLFIIQPGVNGGPPQMLEEVDLPPLAERVCIAHLSLLRRKNPARYAAEKAGSTWSAPAMSKVARPQVVAALEG